MSDQADNHSLSQAKSPEKAMRVRVVWGILLTSILLGAYIGLRSWQPVPWIVLAAAGAIMAGCLIAALFGYPIFGQLAIPLCVTFWIFYIAIFRDRSGDEVLLALPMVILLAGIFLGRRGVVVATSLLVVGLLGIGLIQLDGNGITLLLSTENTQTILPYVILIAVTGTLLASVINQFQAPLQVSRMNEDRLTNTLQDLRVTLADLEHGVEERTHQLSRRARQFQAAAEVSRAVSSIRNLDDLLVRVTHSISEQFGYYHVGVFLLDPGGENAILRASNSTGGHRLLMRSHSLPVGSNSIVGYTTARAVPRVAEDVGQDVVFFNNPDLPETRSEMALPLVAGGKLLGALDVQSTAEAAFTQDDIEVLQVLADQVAIAIENSNLFAEARQALEASQRAYGEISRQAWMSLLRSRPDYGYRSDQRGSIQPVEGDWSDELRQAQQSDQAVKLDNRTLAIPLKILDMPAGVVKLKKQPGGKEWTDREIDLLENLVGNLGEALESARLYEDTQRHAERERITAEISARIRESLDVDTVLQTAAIEMRRALNLEEITIRLGESNG